MFKKAFYAMDLKSLEAYAEFKDKISLESVNLSTSEIKRISAEVQGERSSSKKLFTTDENGTAFITIAGPLEPKPDICAIMFDMEMTTYQDIILATNAAESDENITKITYLFDTPGGNVVGLFKTADVIRKTTKPTKAVVYGMCASAGYALASQCDTIEGENISNEIGSIGVATEIQDNSKQAEGMGITRYVLTSANAENKRPDVTTSEGRDKIVNRLTDLESVFIEYVAVGRNTTTENVKANFGRGGIMLSRAALKIGMIDKIQSELTDSDTSSQINLENNTLEGENMADITMSEEALNKLVADTAQKAVIGATESFNASLAARDEKLSAEEKRKSGFTTLLNKYPKMTGMINEEMNKGVEASLDFGFIVADADAARISAENEQNANAGANPGDGIKKDSIKPEDSAVANEVSALASQFGIDLGGAV